MNALKTGLLMMAIFGLFLLVGAQFGPGGLTIAIIMALAMNGIAYWFSDKIVLAMNRAKEIPPEAAPRLHRMVEELAERAHIPKPRVYVVENPSPNAFATGRNPQHAAVAVTTGIMRLLTDEELEAVLAHELGHVGNRDILIQSIVATVAAAISSLAMMARWGMILGGHGGRDRDRGGNVIVLLAMAILAPIAAMVIQMWISRTREYAADRTGGNLCGNPLNLASALRKLQSGTQRVPLDAAPATAHMYIVNPLSGRSLMSLFSTHPAVEERIARLTEQARKMGQAENETR